MTNAIVFIDTETTSLAPDRHIWEIAMIRRHEGERKVASFFVTVDLRHADPFALKLTRFYDRHPDFTQPKEVRRIWDLEDLEEQLEEASRIGIPDAPPILANVQTAAQLVFHWTRDATIVGAVPNFDTEGLDHMMRQQGLQPAWRYHLRDIETLAVGLMAGRGDPLVHFADDWKSDELSTLCGVEPASEKDRHTALGDALWVERWWDRLLELERDSVDAMIHDQERVQGMALRGFTAAEAASPEGR